jgi:cellulose synthase/poly-beta-1,6-N-acetylglucosamine synthase-like glycosyltransferase/peptidoglycan/xylan/chitin deacetylase (PgdA/CDA1 family)/spore germination protein YaaH
MVDALVTRIAVMGEPIFFDPSGRRALALKLFKWLGTAALLIVAALFALSLTNLPSAGPLPLHPVRTMLARLGLRTISGANLHAASKTIAGSDWERRVPGLANKPAPALVVGFYTPWDDGSIASLQHHIVQLDWLVPSWLSIYGPDHKIVEDADLRGRAIIANATVHPRLMPMIQNANDGVWDGKELADLLADPAARTRLTAQLATYVAAHNAAGIVLDFEEVPAAAQDNYKVFLAETRATFAPHHWLVSIAAPFDDPDWDYAAYAKVTDRLILMAYDQHWETGGAGPIAAEPWFASRLQARLRRLDPAHTIVAIGNYSYDWANGATNANELTVEQAWTQARDNDAAIQLDPASRNPTYTYSDNGVSHQVWMLDAATSYNEIKIAGAYHVAGTALWRMGAEDPSLWRIWGRGTTLSPASLAAIPAGTNVDLEGRGEILQVTSSPSPGARTVTTDSQSLIQTEQFSQLPTPFVIDRGGYKPGLVALTFDDGPDPTWTPQILDILKRKRVAATFFVVGENAVSEPDLLRRMVAEGHEIGNHTYTHPNLALESIETVRLEIAANERAIEAITGHGTRLFRAPFMGDAEPTTPDEIEPILAAQKLGYVSIGLHVDPLDWQQPSSETITARTIAGILSTDPLNGGQIVLLHDAGGDRQATVDALPRIIDGLRAKGYRFVPVSALAGMTAAQVNPATPQSPMIDRMVFAATFGLGRIIAALFLVAITLGIVRALALSLFASREARHRASLPVPAIDPTRFVSVLIPAYNEARVIAVTVAHVLESTDVALEVIVIDDGSTDGTGDIVAAAFANDPRVRLLRLTNGGKARALNQGLTLASGDIIIALDADTQFEPLTIARLARWFIDDRLGAVAGNAKVGNRNNLATRWQALEYISAQNLERRALGYFDAITVVPGAVGAWRAAALHACGGYPADTLAEDQDLTIAVQRAGWSVIYDQTAIAWTEAPESFGALMKQRYRWAFGTLQCLWKHRAILRTGQPRGLARIGLPQAWLFQIGFGLVSPLIDLGLLLSLVTTGLAVWQHAAAASTAELTRLLTYFLVFSAIDLFAAATAFRLEPTENRWLLVLLLPQRFGYRQMMYYVVIKAVAAALTGPRVGWGKLERSASVVIVPQKPAAV